MNFKPCFFQLLHCCKIPKIGWWLEARTYCRLETSSEGCKLSRRLESGVFFVCFCLCVFGFFLVEKISFTSLCEMGKWEVNSKEKSLFCGFTMKLKRKIIFKCLHCKASQSKSLGSFFTHKKDMPDSSFKSYSKCPLALQLWSGKQQLFTLPSDNFQLPFRFRMFCIRKIRTKIFKLHIIK